MKKPNTNNKLAFGKATVTELNDAQLNEVNGGTSPGLVTLSIIVFTVFVLIPYLNEN
jgi:hypothetical protein